MGGVLTADSLALAESLFERLRAMSFDGVGISRETYGPGETEAMRLIEATAAAHGLATGWDAAQNLIVRLPGRRPDLPVVAAGSHLDSVPQGGNFDGAAGVIAVLLAQLAARTSGPSLRTLELIVLRGEESAWFGGPCYFGSRSLFGLMEAADLKAAHRETGRPLADHMAAAGVDLAPIEAGRPLRRPGDFHCWLELHIEQGPVLIARQKPVGVVTGIRGNVRHRRARCIGAAAHSGAVPRWLRQDAVLAMADLLMRLDEHWRILLAWGEDLVLTAGVVATDPAEHAISRVPGAVGFALEYRSQDVKTLENFAALVDRECAEVARERGVSFDLGEAIRTAPARMDGRLVEAVAKAAEAAHVAVEIMPSGAGHDSSVFANAGVPAAMLFVRNDKGSHNPEEAMEMADFMAGAEVMARTLLAAADEPEAAP